MATLGPILTPHGRLSLAQVDDAAQLPPDLARKLEESGDIILSKRGAGDPVLG